MTEPTPPPKPRPPISRFRRKVVWLTERFALLLFLSAATLGTISAYYLNRHGSEILSGLINDAMREREGPIFHGDFSLDLFGNRLTVRNVLLDFPGRGHVKAESVTIDYKPFPTLSGRFIISEITITRPDVEWDVRSKIPAFRPAAPDRPEEQSASRPDDYVHVSHVTLLDGQARFLLPNDQKAEIHGLQFNAASEEGLFRLQLEASGARAETRLGPFVIGETHVRLTLEESVLNIERFETAVNGQPVTLAGRYGGDENPPLTLDASLEDFPLSKLNDLWPGLPAFQGALSVKAAATFKPPLDWEVTGEAAGKEGRITAGTNLFRTEDFILRVKANPTGVWLDGSRFHFADGTIDLPRAELRFENGYPMQIEAELNHVELARILANVSPLHPRVVQWQDGTIMMSGSLVPFVLDGQADLLVTDHSTHSADFRERQKGILIEQVPKAHVLVQMHADPTCFELHDGLVTGAYGEARVDYVHFGFDGHFFQRYASDRFDLRDVNPLLGMTMQGQGSLWCEIDILPGSGPVISAHMDFRNFAVNQFSLGHFASDLRFENNRLVFYNGEGMKDQNAYQTTLEFDFNRSPVLLTADLTTPGMALSTLESILGRPGFLSRKFPGTLAGSATLQGPVSGSIRGMAGEGAFSLNDFRYNDTPASGGQLLVRYHQGVLSFPLIEFFLPRGQIRGYGEVSPETELAFRFESSETRLSSFDFIQQRIGGDVHLDADLSLSAKVYGTLNEPVAELDANIGPTEFGLARLPESEIHILAAPEYMDVSGILFGHQAVFSALLPYSRGNPIRIDARLNNFELPMLAQALSGIRLKSGVISAEAKLEGSLDDLQSAQGRAHIRTLSATFPDDTTLDLLGAADLNYHPEEKLFRLDPAALNWNRRVPFELRGDIDLKGQMNLILSGRADLADLPFSRRLFEQARGPISFKATLSGTPKDLLVSGEAAFDNAMILFKDMESPLQNLTGSLALDGSRLEVRDTHGRYMGGEIEVQGGIDLDLARREIGFIDLRLGVNRLPFPLGDGMTPVLTGRLALTGTPWPLLLQGALIVEEMSYTRTVKWQKKLVLDKIVTALQPRKHRVTEERTPRLTFDILLTADKTIRIKNNLADTKLSSDLRLTGTDVSPGLLNTLSTDQGYVYLYRNEFEILRFVVEFIEPDRIHPKFDILAETHVRYIDATGEEKDVRITFWLQGDLDDPQITLTSDAGFSQTDIISLLVVGQPTTQLQGQGPIASGLNALSDLYGVDEQIRDSFKIDEFRLTSEYSESSTTGGVSVIPMLVIGKEIGDHVFIVYRTSIGEQQDRKDQRFELKYRLDQFILSGEWDNNSTLQHGNFGIDLKFIYDF